MISSDTRLVRDMFYNSLVVEEGVELDPGGYRVFVRNTCTIKGSISRKSKPDVEQTVLGQGSQASTDVIAGCGGAGGCGGPSVPPGKAEAGKGGTVFPPTPEGFGIFGGLPQILTGRSLSGEAIGGGAGGGFGADLTRTAGKKTVKLSGGKGGDGGGVILLVAKTVDFGESGGIKAEGADGNPGESDGKFSAGPGGGGGGGVIVLVTGTDSDPSELRRHMSVASGKAGTSRKGVPFPEGNGQDGRLFIIQ